MTVFTILTSIKSSPFLEHTKNKITIEGIFGPLACSFLFASALQEPGSEARELSSQNWKKMFVFIGLWSFPDH